MTLKLAERRARLAYFVVIPLAALFAVHPLAVHGCSCGHDFDFHLVNWMEAARQFGQGQLHPHWAYSPAFNAGEPRFVFYPPLSWCLGALLGLLFTHLPGLSQAAGWNALPIVFTWIALCASGFTMHRLAREFTSPNAALLASVLYLANPYMLFTAYERTAYAELLAAAWIPLLLLAILREDVTIPRVAIAVALLWLTNAPAAVMGSYVLAFLAGVRVVFEIRGSRRQQAWHTALKTSAGAALGLGLAALYIIPAAFERRFVRITMATIAGMRIDQNFLFEHTGTSVDARLHDSVLHTASVIAVVILITTAVALIVLQIRKNRNKETEPPAFSVTALILLTAAIAFLLISISGPIWRQAPEAEFLQFPWRLLAILAPVCAWAIATALSGLRWKSATTTAATMIVVVGLTLPAYHAFRQRCYPEDTPSEQFDQFRSHGGVDPTDEYTPLTGDNDVLRTNNPPYWIASSPTAISPRTAAGPAPTHLSLDLPKAGFLVLNLRDYPAWRVVRNGVVEATRKKRADGLIALPIPAGSSTIDVRYGHMTDEIAGDAVTLLAFLILLWLWRVSRSGNAPAGASS